MIKNNGFKVVAKTEVVLGKVVEPTEESVLTFKIVEYYINEYKTYIHREIVRFTIKPEENYSGTLVEAFKSELGKHVRLSDVMIEESVFEFINSKFDYKEEK